MTLAQPCPVTGTFVLWITTTRIRGMVRAEATAAVKRKLKCKERIYKGVAQKKIHRLRAAKCCRVGYSPQKGKQQEILPNEPSKDSNPIII